MKTKIFKIGMPFMAFMLAIVFAFATEQNSISVENENLVTGYIFNNNTCEPVTKDCALTGMTPCTFDGKPVYRFINGTVCHTQLYNWM